MFKLVLFELRKTFKHKAYWICLAAAIAMLTVTGIFNVMMFKSTGDSMLESSALSFSKGFISNGMLVTIIGILIAILVCDDAAQGTLKNVIAKGYSRRQVFASKYIASLVAIVGFMLLCLVYTLIFSSITFKKDAVTTNDVLGFVFMFIGVIAYHAVFFSVSEMLEKNGPAIAINLMIPMVVSAAALGIDASGKLKNITVTKLTLSNAISTFSSFSGADADFGKAIAVCVVVTAVFMVAGFFLNSKKEI